MRSNMTVDQNEQEIINYRTGLLVLKEQAMFDLAIASEELRKIKINRQTKPIPDANPFLEVETSYLQDCVVNAVQKELELAYPKVWLEAPESSKSAIYGKLSEFIMDKILNSQEPIEDLIALSAPIEIQNSARQILGVDE